MNARLHCNIAAVPLDEFDAAARICDPIYTALATGRFEYGRLWKNYTIAPW